MANGVQGKEADPSRYVDGISVRVVTRFGNIIWDVVNGDDAVSER